MSALDRLAALRIASRLVRRRSQELQAGGFFTDAELLHEAHVELEGIRHALDEKMAEWEQNGGGDTGGLHGPPDLERWAGK